MEVYELHVFARAMAAKAVVLARADQACSFHAERGAGPQQCSHVAVFADIVHDDVAVWPVTGATAGLALLRIFAAHLASRRDTIL